MVVKPDAGILKIKEQIIEDPVSGLTFQFLLMPDSDAPARLRVFGALRHGNREFLFDRNGQEAGAGTAFGGTCRPSWLREVSD